MEVIANNIASTTLHDSHKDVSNAVTKSEQIVDPTGKKVENRSSDADQGHTEAKEQTSEQALKIEVPSSSSNEAAVAAAAALVPSLKGKMTFNGGQVICKGLWAMSDQAHQIPGQTSDFEFKLVEGSNQDRIYPVDGKYQGWFTLRQPPPLKGSTKIEDKEMQIKFVEGDDEGYKVKGQGHNKFGSFNLRGSLSKDGDIHIYREYYNLIPIAIPARKRQSSMSGDSKKIKTDGSVPLVSPRETGRIRKQSTVMKEAQDTTLSLTKAPSVSKQQSQQKKEKSAPSLSRQESAESRVQRMPVPMKKCNELLKELSRHHLSVWFLEPVDYVKLNIPEYPKIISQPMDFKTIRLNLEQGKYESPDAFAEHMRLVFRNAITFNQLRDNPVHIAAKELAARFEDRFRALSGMINAGHLNAYEETAFEVNKSPRGGGGGNKKRPSKGSSSGFSRVQGRGPGPRAPMPMGLPLPAGGGEGNSHQIMEMQRMIQSMQGEIQSLRSAVRENEIVKRLTETKEAAHNPLTLEEKKQLIAQIHKLSSDKMEHVLEIIQSSIPARESGSDEIEVPLDALDTYTLRKLQHFIEAHAPVHRKRSAEGGAPGGGNVKRRKQPSQHQNGRAAANPMSAPQGPVVLHGPAPMLMEPEEDDLLFAADSFDDLHQQQQLLQQRNQTKETEQQSEKMDFEDSLGEALNKAEKIEKKDESNNMEIRMMNENAWTEITEENKQNENKF